MKTNCIKIFSLVIFLFACALQSYNIHFGENYLPIEHQFALRSTNYFETNQDSIITITGIYNESKLLFDTYPVIQMFDKETGYFTIPVNQKVDFPDGTLIKITGRLQSIEKEIPHIKKTKTIDILFLSGADKISDISKIQIMVDEEYLRLMEKIQKEIATKNSKLKLKIKPEWSLWFCESDNIIIFKTHQFDLMYAVNIEFVTDFLKKRITDIYAVERFKGEM